jgi:hypothetical protein
MKKLAPCLFIALFSSLAYADQCAYITKSEAKSAKSYVPKGSQVLFLCEPCGETQPTPVQVSSSRAKPVGSGNYWGLNINEVKAQDLAYTFVKTSKDTYTNLASLVGCPASGVSETITYP